jgi:hypothetical protein
MLLLLLLLSIRHAKEFRWKWNDLGQMATTEDGYLESTVVAVYNNHCARNYYLL